MEENKHQNTELVIIKQINKFTNQGWMLVRRYHKRKKDQEL